MISSSLQDRFTSLVDPWSLFTNVSDAGEQTHIVNLTDTSPDMYLEACRIDHPKRFKNFRRLESQLGREEGEIGLRWGRPSSSVTIWSGLVTRSFGRKTTDTLWKKAAGGFDVSRLARLRRRLDHVATCETAGNKRLRDLVSALIMARYGGSAKGHT